MAKCNRLADQRLTLGPTPLPRLCGRTTTITLGAAKVCRDCGKELTRFGRLRVYRNQQVKEVRL